MKVFCFLMRVQRQPSAARCAPVARLALCREEAESHPLRISEVREINIDPDPRLIEPQPIEIEPHPPRAQSACEAERASAG